MVLDIALLSTAYTMTAWSLFVAVIVEPRGQDHIKPLHNDDDDDAGFNLHFRHIQLGLPEQNNV